MHVAWVKQFRNDLPIPPIQKTQENFEGTQFVRRNMLEMFGLYEEYGSVMIDEEYEKVVCHCHMHVLVHIETHHFYNYICIISTHAFNLLYCVPCSI